MSPNLLVAPATLSCRSRYLGMRKKTKQEVLDKQAAELQNARREFDEARYQMAHKLIAVECRKEYEFLEAMASSMEAHMHFFRRGLDLFAVRPSQPPLPLFRPCRFFSPWLSALFPSCCVGGRNLFPIDGRDHAG